MRWGHSITAPTGNYVIFFRVLKNFCFPRKHTMLGHSEPYFGKENTSLNASYT